MTFDEYKQGFKKLDKRSTLSIESYNQKVASDCDFKVELGELVDRLAKTHRVSRDRFKTNINLVDWFADKQRRKDFSGVVSINLVHGKDNRQIVETIAKFRVDDNTKFNDDTTLRENTYYDDDYSGRKLRILPIIDLEDIIVTIDLKQEYMNYPAFLKALFKCNVIETQEQVLNK